MSNLRLAGSLPCRGWTTDDRRTVAEPDSADDRLFVDDDHAGPFHV